MEVIRDSIFGQVVRWATSNRVLLYPEEKEGFSWPPLTALLEESDKVSRADVEPRASPESTIEPSGLTTEDPIEEPEKAAITINDDDSDASGFDDGLALKAVMSKSSHLSRTATLPYTPARFDVERQSQLEREKSITIAPTKTSDGTILVDWYATDDPANPQNWTSARKNLVLVQLAAYSLSVYAASSMYVAGEQGVMEEFHVGTAPAALGLAIFVVGYGVGPLLWAPLSEIPVFGRNWVYVPTFFLFVILSIPTAVVKNYAGLLVLRFLTGFFGSPCLSNGGASIGDMYDFLQLPIYLCTWTAACFFGPAIGPLVSGYAVMFKGWRWGLWEIVWLTAPVMVLFTFLYPETSADNILRSRAQRLRKLTGRTNIKSQSEINQANLRPREVAYDALIKPLEICAKDPAVLFTNLYTALTYGIYYSFFEAFPLVYPPYYNFNLGEVGIVFCSTIAIGCLLGAIPFILYQVYHLIPDIQRNGMRAPEYRLVPALIGVLILPVGLFLFAWTSRPSVHWIASLIGVVIFVGPQFWVFQSIFIYLPLSYPRYAASLFAGNDVFRSLFAAACVMFSRPMFLALGIGGGVSLLAGLTCVGTVGMFVLWKFGAALRARSTFAQS